MLIKNGAKINVFNLADHSPLMLAARHGYSNVVRALIRGGARVDQHNAKKEIALHYAVSNDNPECVEELLIARSNLNQQDMEGGTPLILACKLSIPRMARLLLEAGANKNLADDLGRSPLHWAVYVGDDATARLLISSGARVDAFDKNGHSPFVVSVMANRVAIMQALLDAKCDRNTIDGLNGTALGLASLKGHNAIVELLLETNDDPDEIGYFGMTPLMSAVFESHVPVVRTLLKYGANPNVTGRMGASPLIKAFCHIGPENAAKRQQIVVELIRANVNVNYRVTTASYFTAITNGKNCPLSFAISSGYVSLVRMLLIAGSEVYCHEIREWYNRGNGQFYDKREILRPIKEWKENVRCLKQFCRSRIRESLREDHCDLWSLIDQLPIAKTMKEYVNYIDLEQMEVERATKLTQSSPMILNMTQSSVCPCGLRAIEGTFLHQTMSGAT